MPEKSPTVLLLEDILKTHHGKAALRSTLKCPICGGNSIAFSVNMGVRKPQDFATCTFTCVQCRRPIRSDVPKPEEREVIREQWKEQAKARNIHVHYKKTLRGHRSDIIDEEEAGDVGGFGGDVNRADDTIQVLYFCTEEAISFEVQVTEGLCKLSEISLLKGTKRIKVYSPSIREFVSVQTRDQRVYVEGATLICMDNSMNAADCEGLDQMLADLHDALPYHLSAPSIARTVDSPEVGPQVESDSDIEFIGPIVPITPPETPAKGKEASRADADESRRDGKKRKASGDAEGSVAPTQNRRRLY